MADQTSEFVFAAVRAEAADAHHRAWSMNTAKSRGWDNVTAHNQGMTDAVLDVAARYVSEVVAERLAAVEAAWDEGYSQGYENGALQRRAGSGANPYRAATEEAAS